MVSSLFGNFQRGFNLAIIILFVCVSLWAFNFHNYNKQLEVRLEEKSQIIDNYQMNVIPGLQQQVANLEAEVQRLQQEQALLSSLRQTRQTTEDRVTVFLQQEQTREVNENRSIIDAPGVPERIDRLRDFIESERATYSDNDLR